MKSSHQKIKKQKLDIKRIGIALGALALLLLTVILAFSGREKPVVGQAFFVDQDNPPSGVINLAQEETLIFRRLPSQASTVRFSTATDFGGTLEAYTLTLIKESNDIYVLELNRSADPPRQLVLRDRLDTAGDTTSIYLNTLDTIPDLEVSLQNGQVFVSNLHFVSSDLLKVMMFHNVTGAHLGRVLRVNISDNLNPHIFNGKLNTSSPVYPEVEFNIIPTLGGIPNPYNASLLVDAWDRPVRDINRTFNVTWGPASEPVSLLLNITSNIQGSRTSKFLVLAVGNRTLDVNTTGYPIMRVDFTDLDHQGRTARLNVTFRATTELQPFALPCRLSEASATLYASGHATGFLAKANIDKIYSYDPVNNRALQSASDAPIGQIARLKQFEGYFVQLTRPETTSLIFGNCEVEDPRLLGVGRGLPPNVGNNQPTPPQLTHIIRRGWNLISIPGVVPTSLKEIAPANTRFELFACKEDEVCARIDLNTPLQPGRAYWVHSTSEFAVTIE